MDYASIEWRDGQPYSRDFDDIYFSLNDGRGESEYVFLQQNDLATRFAHADRITIAETGFGTGLNFVLTLKLWQACAPAHARLDYFAIEFAPLSPADIARAAQCWPDLAESFAEFISGYPLPVIGRHLCSLKDPRVRLHFMFMDVVAALEGETLGVDAWFLDGFAPAKNPQIWNDHVYALLAQNSAEGASLATYSAAGAVRRGLERAGFAVEKRAGHGNKREMITARLVLAASDVVTTKPWYRLEKNTVTNKRATVIGAGLAGLATAWSLSKRGWRVTLIDRHAVQAGEASGNPLGLVSPRLSLDDTVDARFYHSAFLYAVTMLDSLQDAQTISSGKHLWRQGGVCFAMPASRAQRMLANNAFHPDYLHGVENDGVYRLPAGDSLLLLPRAGWASPELICAAMRLACGDHLQYLQAEVSAIEQVSGSSEKRWRLLTGEQEPLLETELLVLANGIDATRFSQTAFLPIQSARGQITRLLLKPGACAPERAYSGQHYLAPDLDNENIYYCGASYHLDDACTALRETDQQSNLAFANRCFPGIFAQPDEVCGRVGFRAVSDDRLPVIGPVPDLAWFENEYADLRHGRPIQAYAPSRHLPGLYVSLAHGSRGMTSCFLAAEIIAAQIDGTTSPVEQKTLDALNPARFIIRRLKRGD